MLENKGRWDWNYNWYSRGSTPPEKTNTGGFSFKSVLTGGAGKEGGGGGGGNISLTICIWFDLI